jgi:hypothetical protein
VVFTQVDEEGQVEKFYNPHVNPDFGKAEWENYLDISVDPVTPTEVSIDQVHSGQVLMSALIKNGTEQWWNESQEFNGFAIVGQASLAGDNLEYKSTEILFGPTQKGDNRPGYHSTSRFLGFYKTNFDSDEIVVGMVQTLVSEDGKTVSLNAGYSGDILTTMWDANTTYMQRAAFSKAGDELFRLYRGIDDNLVLARNPGLVNYLAVQRLYEQDSNNQHWRLFPEMLSYLKAIKRVDLTKPTYMWNMVESEVLRELAFEVLYPIDQH